MTLSWQNPTRVNINSAAEWKSSTTIGGTAMKSVTDIHSEAEATVASASEQPDLYHKNLKCGTCST